MPVPECRCRFETPFGPLALEALPGGLTACRWTGEAGNALPSGRETVAARAAAGDPAAAHLVAAMAWLGRFAGGDPRPYAGPLDPGGTPFRRRVWAVLRRVPFGTTATYAELARAAGRPNAVRAVGAANGANPLAIVLPCHRIIGADGQLTGYAGGLERKRRLLAHEGHRFPPPQGALFVP